MSLTSSRWTTASMVRSGYPAGRLRYRTASGVLVVAANPGLEGLALVASLRRAVEDRVVAHQELDAAEGGAVGLVDGAVLERERAHGRDLRDVLGEVGSARVGVVTRDRRQLVLGRHVLAHLLHQDGGAYVVAEVGIRRRHPWSVPTHPLLVGLKTVHWRRRDEHQGQVAGVQVRQEPVEAIEARRARRAPRLVGRAEHEVVDQQL